MTQHPPIVIFFVTIFIFTMIYLFYRSLRPLDRQLGCRGWWSFRSLAMDGLSWRYIHFHQSKIITFLLEDYHRDCWLHSQLFRWDRWLCQQTTWSPPPTLPHGLPHTSRLELHIFAKVYTTVWHDDKRNHHNGTRWKHILSGEFDIDDLDPNHSFSSYSTGLTLGACFNGNETRCWSW